MNNQPHAGRALDTVMAAALTIPASEWRAICFVDDHAPEDNVYCYQCHSLVAEQPRVPERYSTDIAASEQLVAAMHARGYWCKEYSDANSYGCEFATRETILDFAGRSPHGGRTAPTRPLARCYAALAALAAEDGEEG